MTETVIVLFRRDLRLADNGALYSAADSGFNIVPVYIHDPEQKTFGAAGACWLRHSLIALDKDLQRLGSRLIVRNGSVIQELESLVKQSGAFAVYLNTIFEPDRLAWEKELEAWGRKAGIIVKRFNSALLYHPKKVTKVADEVYLTFTPYYDTCMRIGDLRPPAPAPTELNPVDEKMVSIPVEALGLSSKSPLVDEFGNNWVPSEQAAWANLQAFVNRRLSHYPRRCDQLAKFGTSRLSPYLSWGQLSPVQIVWATARQAPEATDAFVRQLYWREFAYYLLYHFPQSVSQSLDSKFEHFPWHKDQVIFEVWTQGETGVPLVDAGMRELLATGWMHHRARVVVASFLTKNMLIDWRWGVDYFMSASLDADLANCTFGWQWISGCGVDGIPFFRVINPAAHGEKYDSDGSYVRHWVPELAQMPDKWLHRPWEAPEDVLTAAEVRLGKNYPPPVVDPKESRQRALDHWSKIRIGMPG